MQRLHDGESPSAARHLSADGGSEAALRGNHMERERLWKIRFQMKIDKEM